MKSLYDWYADAYLITHKEAKTLLIELMKTNKFHFEMIFTMYFVYFSTANRKKKINHDLY